ncbi:MAG: arsenic efflux protein [Oscillospiraceae bacterium]|nr:arsenic efflux protein [Oscillospiraceae bacterium]
MLEVLLDTLLDSLKILPFLFLAFLVIELIEHKAGERTLELINRSGRFGPLIGSVLGVVPQCGFSAATSNLYAGGVITKGTLIAVFLSTSDEMLPILVSERAPAAIILKILAVKVVVGIIAGFIIDVFLGGRRRRAHIGDLCNDADCHCEEHLLLSVLKHTVQVFVFILIVSFLLNTAVYFLGEERLSSFILNRPIVGELLSGVIGVIPNCAASVVITQLYLQGGMSAGAMLAGLLVNSGVGILVLFRMNRNLKD